MGASWDNAGRIGIFDSGIGGLLTMRAIISALPEYDYVYAGDTAHMPYGLRSVEDVYALTTSGVSMLFAQGCTLVIIACNTASAGALRRLQQEVLPRRFPGRRVLGVIIPIVEDVMSQRAQRIGILATKHTVQSGAYAREIQKRSPSAHVYQVAADGLAEAIEHGKRAIAARLCAQYAEAFAAHHIDTLVLGCTHYPLLCDVLHNCIGNTVRMVTQEEVVPVRLAAYLARHRHALRLTRTGTRRYIVSAYHDELATMARDWFGEQIILEQHEDFTRYDKISMLHNRISV